MYILLKLDLLFNSLHFRSSNERDSHDITRKEEFLSFPQKVDSNRRYINITGMFNGFAVILSQDQNHVIFVTNQHLVFNDPLWCGFLCLNILAVYKFTENFLCSELNGRRMRLIISIIAAVIVFYYYIPFFALSPTKFRLIYQNTLRKCSTLYFPYVGVEPTFSGIYKRNHIFRLNDWVLMKCPIEILNNMKYSLSKYSPCEKEACLNKTIAVNHLAEDWWINNKLEEAKQKDLTSGIRKYHYRYWNEIGEMCRLNSCWWVGSIVEENDYYYTVNSSLFNGESGLGCKAHYEDEEFSGLVQNYHSGKRKNVCTKLGRNNPTYSLIYFCTIPYQVMVLMYTIFVYGLDKYKGHIINSLLIIQFLIHYRLLVN